MFGKLDYNGTASYIIRAGNDYKYFDIDDWYGVTNMVNNKPEAIFEINKKFIWNARQKGNNFFFSHNPFDPEIADGYLKMEIDYLESLGYTLDPIPVSGNLWKATK